MPLKVSVLMSVYNGERFLREAVESILNQTFADFEFIIVDDGSPDKTPQILAGYAEKDRRIKLIKNEKNIGLAKSLNRALEIATGEYVARHDADDISLPHRLERQLSFLDANPQVGAAGSFIEYINNDGVFLGIQRFPECDEDIKAFLLINNCMSHPALVVGRPILQKAGGYNPELFSCADYDLLRRLSGVTRLANLPEILVKYRWADNYYSKLHQKRQTEDAFGISLKTVSGQMKAGSLDEEAYGGFWRAYNNRPEHSGAGQVRLQKGSITRLAAFWEFLAGYPDGPRVWVKPLTYFAGRLITHGQISEGVSLLKALHKYFKQPISKLTLLLFRACLAGIVKQGIS